MQPGEIVKRFTSHPINSRQQRTIEEIREGFLTFAQNLAAVLPEGREESIVMAHLEDASFHAVAAVARNGLDH